MWFLIVWRLFLYFHNPQNALAEFCFQATDLFHPCNYMDVAKNDFIFMPEFLCILFVFQRSIKFLYFICCFVAKPYFVYLIFPGISVVLCYILFSLLATLARSLLLNLILSHMFQCLFIILIGYKFSLRAL